MKGFLISIKNDLLEPKHRKAMREGVWLYMWLLDKMTSISEEGIGVVLGGRPVTYDEVNRELEVSERGYNQWIARLRSGGYINTRRAPYGLVITVNKAFKPFKRTAQSSERTARNTARTAQSADVIKTDTRQYKDRGFSLQVVDNSEYLQRLRQRNLNSK